MWDSTKEMMAKTKLKNEQMVKDKYKPPQKLTNELNEKLRKEKQDLVQLHENFSQTVQYDMPRASKEKVEATVFRKMYEAQHVKQEPEDPELTLKPNMQRTLKN